MAAIAASSSLLLAHRSKQPWTPASGLECSQSLQTRAVSSTVNRKTRINFSAWDQLIPADVRLRTKRCAILRRSSNHRWQCSVRENPRTLQASSMNETYDALARHLLSAASLTEPGQKYMVGIAGSPGAGKSTVAQKVSVRLNALWQKNVGEKTEEPPAVIAVAVPMDGFHLYRRQLDAMEDPVEAHARRGAHWTFDPASLVKNLQQLRIEGCAHLPSFDHGVGDPIEKDIYVSAMHRVVLVEGNYLLMEEGEWTGLADLFDERWYVDIDIDEAMNRVEKRHVSTGNSPAYAKQRVVYNDRPNAELIALTKRNADLIIPSISVY